MATQLKIVEGAPHGGSLSDRIRPYLPEIAKRAAATEQARMVPPENIALMKEAGFFRSLVPKSRGGDGRDLIDYANGIRLVASACPSTAWVAGVLAVHPVGIIHFTKQCQDEFWATGPDTIASSSGSPVLKAVRVEGGVRVSGKGRWSSGCDHASWCQLGLLVPNPANRQYPEFRYSQYFAMVPRSNYTIDDTWYSTGLRGTGSKDIVLDDVFIPYHRMERIEELNFGKGKGFGTNDDSWMAHTPFGSVFATFLPAVALGCADGMVEEYKKRQKSRKNAYTGNYGITSVPGYMRLAESLHELEATSLFYEKAVRAIQQFGVDREKISEEAFIGMNTKYGYVPNRVRDIVCRMFNGAGSSAIADFNPMQRFWRDAQTVSLHLGMDYDMGMQMFGRNAMGLGMDPTL